MNRKRENRIALIVALLIGVVMLAVPALAGCPPGTINLGDPGTWGTAITTDGPGTPATIVRSGTYCVPAPHLRLGAGGVASQFIIDVPTGGVIIVGEVPSATVRIQTGSWSPVFTVRSANVTLHSFVIALEPGVAVDGILVEGMNCVIEGIRFIDEVGTAFPTYAIRLNGLNPIVQNNRFYMRNSPGSSAVVLAAGSGARIISNTVIGALPARPGFLVQSWIATYNNVEISDNTVLGGIGTLVSGSFSGGSKINRNVATTGNDGIVLQVSTGVTVDRNEITYGMSVSGAVGILDSGGSGNYYTNNRLTASTTWSAPDDGIQFSSHRATIDGNTIDARGGAAATGDGINASGGASSATITNNTILGTGIAGWGVGIRMNNPANIGFKVGRIDPDSQKAVDGNTISNTAGGGILAAGGTEHVIVGNTLTNIGTAPGLAFPAGTAIVSNGGNRILGNTIIGVKAGRGIFTDGPGDTISGNTVRSLSAPQGSGIVVWINGITATIGTSTIPGWDTKEKGRNTIENVSGVNAHGIEIAAGSCKIRDNTIRNITGGDGIRISDSGMLAWWGGITAGNQEITGNTVENIASGVGINLTDSDNNDKVSGNTITNTGKDGILVFAVPGIMLTEGTQQLLPGVDARNNNIQNNTITDAATLAADVAAVGGTRSQRYAAIHIAGNADLNTVDSNIIINAGSAVYAVGIDVLGTATDIPDNNKIDNNTLSGFTTVTTGAFVSQGIRVLSGRENTVRGNTVKNSSHFQRLQFGIDIRTVEKLLVTGNTVERMREGGLYLRGGTAGNPLLVQGNTLIGNVTGVWMVAGAANITQNLISGGATGVYVDSLGNAARFHFKDNCIDSPVLVNNEGLNTLNATGNYWATPPVLGVNVFGNVNVADPLAACPGDPGVPSTVCHIYPRGWNLLSVPLVPNDPAVDAVFNEIPGVILFHYDACAGVFTTPTVVSPTVGFWLFLHVETEICFEGAFSTADQMIVLPCAGWHQIGTAFDADWLATQVSHGGQTRNVMDAGDWILLPIFSYDPVARRHNIARIMKPHLGYWVHTKVDNVTLRIPFQPPGTPSFYPMGLRNPEGLTPPPPPPIPGTGGRVTTGLIFTNAPNPVTDVNTTTFMVKGVLSGLVERIKVQIFDLSGRLVFEAEEAGARLDWHTDNMYGEFLANGIYLYKLYVWIGDKWVVSEVRKLAIFR